ncbi:18.1 kDa class I heat shock protein, partial [Bienertia sinuspersici]
KQLECVLLFQNCSSNVSSTFKRLDKRLLFARQASSSQGKFMRQATSIVEQVLHLIALLIYNTAREAGHLHKTNGFFPKQRINVIDSNSGYVTTIELPGVEINDIRVEMDDK